MKDNRIKLGCGTEIALKDLEASGISFVPCGQVEGKDQPLFPYKNLWGQRRQVTLASFGKKANAWTLEQMTGVQIMTGAPTYRPNKRSPNGFDHLTDVDIENAFLKRHPDTTQKIIDVYRSACVGTPTIIRTKSDGRRLSAFVPLLEAKREFKDTDDQMLMELFSLKGLSRLDSRYAMIEGSLLQIPTLPKAALQEIHGLISEIATEKQHHATSRSVVEKSQIGDLDIHWDAEGKSQYFPAAHCQATSHKDTTRATVQFQKYRGGTQGHCFNCGESWWEVPPPTGTAQGTAPKLRRLPTQIIEKEELAILRNLNQKTVSEWLQRTEQTQHPEMLLMNTGTGTAKTTTAILNVEAGVFGLGTTPLAEEAYEKALEDGKSAMLWRGRYHGLEDWKKVCDGDTRRFYSPEAFAYCYCPYAPEAESLAIAGYNVVKTLCLQCSLQNACPHLAQFAAATENKLIFFGLAEELLSDRRLSNFVEMMGIPNAEKVIVIDEPTPSDFRMQRALTLRSLSEASVAWGEYPEGELLRDLVKELSVAQSPKDFQAALEAVLGPRENEKRKKVIFNLMRIPVTYTFDNLSNHPHLRQATDLREKKLFTAVVDMNFQLGTEHRCVKGVVCAKGVSPELVDVVGPEMHGRHIFHNGVIPKHGYSPQRRYHRTVSLEMLLAMGILQPRDIPKLPINIGGLLLDLATFYDENKERKNPIACSDGDIWEFSLNPVMNVRRAILLSASGLEHVKPVFSHLDVNFTETDGTPAQWHPGNYVYQLSTGRYTSQSLFNVKNGEKVGIKKFAKRCLEIIQAAAETEQVLVVAPHAFTADGDLADVSSVSDLLAHPNIHVVTHKKAQGRNEFTDCGIGFAFLFEPPPPTVQHHVQFVYPDQEFTFERASASVFGTGTATQMQVYVEPEVQSVYEWLTSAQLMQDITRLRQMLYPDKLFFVLSAHPILGLPQAPIPVRLKDLEACLAEHGTLRALNAELTRQQEQQKCIENRLENGEGIHIIAAEEKIAWREVQQVKRSMPPNAHNLHESSMHVTLHTTCHNYIPMTSGMHAALHVTLHDKILQVLSAGAKTTGEIYDAVTPGATRGQKSSITKELKRLVDSGEIVRVKRGVYRASEDATSDVTFSPPEGSVALHFAPIESHMHAALHDQILAALKTGEKRTAELVAACGGNSPTAVKNELKRLVDSGEIVRVKRGVYRSSEDVAA